MSDKQTIAAPDPARVREQRQRSRSIAIALALGAMSILFYAATIARMGGNVGNRPLAVSVMPIWSLAR